MDEAEKIVEMYRKAYPGVVRYWDCAVREARRNGFVQNIAGRRVILTKNASAWDGDLGWKLSSTAINYPIQSVGADMKYLALATLRPQMKSLRLRFSHDLHDGLFFLAPEDRAVETAIKVRGILDNLDYRKAWGFEPPIPLPWDAKVGPNWGDLHEV
jgi:DNA polymerase I-like protein with 3'-5' exonuclease and polymerase domains